MTDSRAAGVPAGVGLLAFYPYRAMERRVLDALAMAGFSDITAAQSRVFQRLDPTGGVRISDIAAQAHVTKQTATFLIDQIERAGYVRRAADPADARVRRVELTARGHQVCRLAKQTEAAVEAEWRQHLGNDWPRLVALLHRLGEITEHRY